MKTQILLFLVLVVFLVSSFKGKTQAVNVQDSLALVDLYNSTNGLSWNQNANWLTKAPLASWSGVKVFDGRVVILDLTYYHLVGKLPSSLGNLTQLQKLDIGYSDLSDSIPSSLGNLISLYELHLQGDGLTGSIPQSFGNLVNLTSLDLSDNQLTGLIPASLGNLVKLGYLALTSNQLTGLIPDSFGNLTNLTTLDMRSNKLTGPIPASLGKLTNLRYLYLLSNQLTGSIPVSLGKLANLATLDMRSNKLTGPIPASLGKLTGIYELLLSDNQLTGAIPDSLGYLTYLRNLDLKNNAIGGSIPPSLGNLRNLENLDLSDNLLTGSITDTIGKLPKLDALELENNQLSGPIPVFSYLGSIYPSDSLVLQNNKFTFNGMENLPNQALVTYSPQANIPLTNSGNTLSVSAGGTPSNDTFRLYRDGQLQKTQIADSNFTIILPGKYAITATNAIATQLTLYSDTLNINSDSLILPARPNTEYASYEYTDAAGWTHYYYNNNTPNDLTDDTLLLSLKKNGQDIGSIGDGTFAVKLVATAAAGSNTGVHLTNLLITNTSGYWVMNRYWQVTPTHEPAASVGVRFYYNNQDLKDVNGSYPTHNLTNNKLIFYKAVGGNPDPTTNLAGATNIISILPGTVASDTSWTYHALSDTTQYGEYSVASFSGGGGGGTGNNQALPVVLINFTASLLKNDAQLNWQTSQEVNAGHYTVERSLTGTGFTAIGTVEAVSNSTITQSYKLTDYNAAFLNTTELHYRLKIADKDGNFTYSKVITLNLGVGSSPLVVYPNPAQNTATIAFTATAAGKYAIEIADMAGKTVKRLQGTSKVGINTLTVDVKGYAQGAYIIKISGDYVSKQSLKLVKQ